MSQPLSMPSECQGFAALCLTLFAVAYNFSVIPLMSIGIVLTAFSFTITSFVISFSLLTGLAATPFISALWSIADLVHEGKAEEQVTVWMPTALALNLFQTALVGLSYLLAMRVTLIMLLKYLTIDDPFPPKSVIYSGIPLLGVGIWQLHTVVAQQVSSLESMPGLILMGVGSGLFLAYIEAITYSVSVAISNHRHS